MKLVKVLERRSLRRGLCPAHHDRTHHLVFSEQTIALILVFAVQAKSLTLFVTMHRSRKDVDVPGAAPPTADAHRPAISGIHSPADALILFAATLRAGTSTKPESRPEIKLRKAPSIRKAITPLAGGFHHKGKPLQMITALLPFGSRAAAGCVIVSAGEPVFPVEQQATAHQAASSSLDAVG